MVWNSGLLLSLVTLGDSRELVPHSSTFTGLPFLFIVLVQRSVELLGVPTATFLTSTRSRLLEVLRVGG